MAENRVKDFINTVDLVQEQMVQKEELSTISVAVELEGLDQVNEELDKMLNKLEKANSLSDELASKIKDLCSKKILSNDWKELIVEDEKTKEETNFEHYFEYLSKLNMSDFALIDGRVTQCLDTVCSECDFNHDCIEGKFTWLKQPYEKPKYKLTKFEFDLIQTYRDCHESCKISEFKQLIELKDKGYFKCIDHDTKIQDVLKNCEVIQ